MEAIGFVGMFALGALFWGAAITFVYKKIKQWSSKVQAARLLVPPASPAPVQPVCPPAAKGVCPGCSAPVPEGMAFCMQCGARIPEPPREAQAKKNS